MNGIYDDMIDLPRPVSKTHEPMKRIDRAAQFAPFAALTGYAEAINETGRYVDKKTELSQSEIDDINDKLGYALSDNGAEHEVCLVCFFPDGKKSGGRYGSVKGVIKKIDEVEREIVFTDGTRVKLGNVHTVSVKGYDDISLSYGDDEQF